jgi:peptidoglycan/LPS O-acetylase OafA/YrhL
LEQKTDFGRNNLDFLRLLFASIVVFYHIGVLEPVQAFSGFRAYMSGAYAVKSFFVISGMLIYRSYLKSSSLSSYFEKRVRRIYPAYFTVVTFAGIALFPLSTLSAKQYFLSVQFWKYLASNLVFLNYFAPSLPGVFQGHAFPAVNGALWTLKVEALFYISVPIIGYLCRRFGTRKVLGTFFCLSYLWLGTFQYLALKHPSTSFYSEMGRQLPGQLVYFIAGIALLLCFDKLKLYFPVVLGATVLLYFADSFLFAGMTDFLWISGIVFVVGFWRYLGNFSKYGDFSYGTYIIHFPLIQVMISLGFMARGPLVFVLVTWACVSLGSFLMWHLVEKWFLSRISHFRLGSAPQRAG